MEAAVIVLGAIGLFTQIEGQREAGRAAEEQAEREAELHAYNAQLAEKEARQAQEAAMYEETKLRKGGERLKARQRALYTKAGVTFEGSPLDVMERTASELEMDALLIRRGGVLGYQRYTAEAALSRMAGRSALLRGRAQRRASKWGIAATGLGGAAQLGYQYGSMTGLW